MSVESKKTQQGESFKEVIVATGAHLLDYPCTDGGGSTVYITAMALQLCINPVKKPPHEQSLTDAEQMVNGAFAATHIHLNTTGASQTHTALAPPTA